MRCSVERFGFSRIGSILSTEFPVDGLDWTRVSEMREALKEMLAAL